jgi:hypothetical protein
VDSALLQRENNVIISSSFNNKLFLRDFISTFLVGQNDKIIINAMFPIIFGIKKTGINISFLLVTSATVKLESL